MFDGLVPVPALILLHWKRGIRLHVANPDGGEAKAASAYSESLMVPSLTPKW